MDPVLQPVDDKLGAQAQQIAQLEAQVTALQAQITAENAVKVFDGLELTPWLVAGGAAANTGSTGAVAVASQGQPGASSAYFGVSPTGPYANSYFYKKLGADPSRTHFRFELSLLFASSVDAAASQCVELDFPQVIGGLVFNMGWQFNFQGNQVRVWDRKDQKWVPTPVSCPRWSPGVWMAIVADMHRDDKNVYHDVLRLNDISTTLDMSFPAVRLGLPDMLNCAVQLDTNKAAKAYKVYADRMKVTLS